jgi:hypothetical protein
LSRHWNGSTTASSCLIVADKPLYIFGGSEICRLPYIHLLQNNSAPMNRNKNSIQMGYQCKNPFVCCLSVYLHFRQSLIPVAVCGFKYRLERGKVFGVNTLRRRKIQPETACRSTFQLSKEVCTSFADEQRKWVIGGIGKLIISQIDDRPNSNNHTHTMKSSPPFCPFIKKL